MRGVSLWAAQDHDLGRTIAPLVDRFESRWRDQVLDVGELDGGNGAGFQPARLGEGGERRRGEARAIGRIEEGKVAAFARGRRMRGIGADYLGCRGFAELAQVLADQLDRR